MPRIAYTPAQKAEAVALATVIGSEAASKQLSIDYRTIRKWSEKAGKTPADAVSTSSWENLLALALSKVSSALSTGKVSVRDSAVVAGIAQRHVREPAPPPEPKTLEQEHADALRAAIAERWPEAEDELAAYAALLERAYYDEQAARRGEPTEDPPEDEIANDIAYLESLGDLRTYWASRDARRLEQDARWREQDRLKAVGNWQQWYLTARDDHTRRHLADLITKNGGTVPEIPIGPEALAVIEAAEAYLREHRDS